MRKLLIVLCIAIMLVSVGAVYATSDEPGQGGAPCTPDSCVNGSQGTGNQVVPQNKGVGGGDDDNDLEEEEKPVIAGHQAYDNGDDENKTPGGNSGVLEIRERVKEKAHELDQETENKSRTEQKVWKNQNTVREAVHALLLMKDELGGIGQQVSAIARGFDNSVNKTAKLEEKIQKRGWITKLFKGGDKETATELESEVKANKARIEEMKQLKNSCDCKSDEIKEMYAEQIQLLEQEQTRLGELAEKEKNSRGIFGWFRKK